MSLAPRLFSIHSYMIFSELKSDSHKKIDGLFNPIMCASPPHPVIPSPSYCHVVSFYLHLLTLCCLVDYVNLQFFNKSVHRLSSIFQVWVVTQEPHLDCQETTIYPEGTGLAKIICIIIFSTGSVGKCFQVFKIFNSNKVLTS